jgi:pilus assembly protein CpaF
MSSNGHTLVDPRSALETADAERVRDAIFRASIDYFLEPIRALLHDPSITEIMVNGPDEIYIERAGRLEKTECRFANQDLLLSAARNVAQWVGRELNPDQPALDARLPDGSRVHILAPPACRSGVCLTIRKFYAGGLSLDDLIARETLSPAAREFLEICVRLGKNIMVAGGTGTGKTCLLSALAAAIPARERVIVIEDTSELRLPQPHVLYLESRPASTDSAPALTIRQLFVASLRMRPDRILVGEVRGGEALDMVQSMLSGHAGSLSTVHANAPREALTRLETLVLMADVQLPVYVARTQVASAIDLVVHISRFSQDGTRRITRISEVTGLDDRERYLMRDLFALSLAGESQAAGRLVLAPTGNGPSFADEPRLHGLADQIQYSRDLWKNSAGGNS